MESVCAGTVGRALSSACLDRFSVRKICYQINLQPSLGGGEIYTRFLTHALSSMGWDSILVVARDASFWKAFMPSGVHYRSVWDMASLQSALPEHPALILTHSALPEEMAPAVASRHRLCGVVHMPLYERSPRGLQHYHRLFAVSDHVRNSALSHGLANLHPEPLYAVADLAPRGESRAVMSGSPYEWDRRKFRDRFLGWGQRTFNINAGGVPYSRSSEISIGIVSRLTPIKQFPEMLSILAPFIAKHAGVKLEIFGSGGYASIRDMMRALLPARGQVRWWGPQSDVAAVYRNLDYVISGLPEKEALGLNLIEAQMCGTPVLAVRAPPFTETVVDKVSGYLFCDPRKDEGREFAQLLDHLGDRDIRPDPRRATEHLARFSAAAFQARLERALEALV